MTIATLIRKHLIEVAIYSSEVQSFIIRQEAWWYAGRGAGGVAESLHLVGNRKSTEILSSILSIENLKACPYSDTLPPTKPLPMRL